MLHVDVLENIGIQTFQDGDVWNFRLGTKSLIFFKNFFSPKVFWST